MTPALMRSPGQWERCLPFSRFDMVTGGLGCRADALEVLHHSGKEGTRSIFGMFGVTYHAQVKLEREP
jgi:hypothetical protein